MGVPLFPILFQVFLREKLGRSCRPAHLHRSTPSAKPALSPTGGSSCPWSKSCTWLHQKKTPALILSHMEKNVLRFFGGQTNFHGYLWGSIGCRRHMNCCTIAGHYHEVHPWTPADCLCLCLLGLGTIFNTIHSIHTYRPSIFLLTNVLHAFTCINLPHNSSAFAIFLGSTDAHGVSTTSDTMANWRQKPSKQEMTWRE